MSEQTWTRQKEAEETQREARHTTSPPSFDLACLAYLATTYYLFTQAAKIAARLVSNLASPPMSPARTHVT